MEGFSLLIKHVAYDTLTCREETKGASGRDSKTMHGFTAKELPDAATQHSKAIGETAVRSSTRAFELKLPSFPSGVENFSESYGAAVA